MTVLMAQMMGDPPMLGHALPLPPSPQSSPVLAHHKRPRLQPTFYPGDRVDAMDLESVWHEGRVREVDPIQGYRVHFLGWSGRWDEWIELSSERIQPPYTKVRLQPLLRACKCDRGVRWTQKRARGGIGKGPWLCGPWERFCDAVCPDVHVTFLVRPQLPNWRRLLRVGDPVEVRSSVHTDRWLSGVVVAVCEEEERVLCEYSHDSRWVDLTSEEICLPNTHFSRELDSLSPQVSGLDGRGNQKCTL